jgi:hypothetical protein
MSVNIMARKVEEDIRKCAVGWQHLKEDTEVVYLWNFLPWSEYSRWIFHMKLTLHVA